MNTTTTDLTNEQIIIERNSRDMGIKRYNRQTTKHREKGSESDADFGRKLIKHNAMLVAAGVSAFVKKAKGGGAGRRTTSVKYLEGLSPEKAAVLAMTGILNGITRPRSLTAVASDVGGMVEDEMRTKFIEEHDYWMGKRIKDMAAERHSYHNKRTLMVHISNVEEVPWVNWEKHEKVRLGMTLIDIVMDTIGLITVERMSRRKGTTTNMVLLRDDARDLIEASVNNGGLLTPIYEPMVVQPRDWVTPYTGAYISNYIRKPKLVKSRARGYMKFLKTVHMPDVYKAVNTAQRTKYTIDTWVLDVMETIFNFNNEEAGLPPTEREEPPTVADINALTKEERKEHRAKRAAVRDLNIENSSKRLAFLQALSTAKKFSEYQDIWMPVCLDFRGRLYQIPTFNVQGPDYMKALLRFSEAGPMGDSGAHMLALHIANTGDFGKISKKSHKERKQWTIDNTEMLLSCAADPLGDKRWMEADKPFQFLVAARDWAGYCEHGPSFVSTVMCAFDGTASGLQHYSAMLRDEVGAKHVNLLPLAQPSDIYSVVAEDLNNTLYEEREEPLARAWMVMGVDRKTTKRGCMTLGYGSRAFGFSEQLQQDILKNADVDSTLKPYMASFLAKRLYNSASKAVVKAVEGMEWVRAVARHMTKNGKSVKWVTPDGFPVVQSYSIEEGKLVNFRLAGKRIRLMIVEETQKTMARNSQVTGAPPNFVHSYDGYHLRSCILDASSVGVENFALVHDSFGTSADQAAALFNSIRSSFVRLYKERDPITELYQEALDYLPTDKAKEALPVPPERGDLNIEDVLKAPYCFS